MIFPIVECYLDSPVEEVVATTDRYKKYIINSWKYQRSSGTCKGLNKRIKAMKRASSFDVHSFDVFRKRILTPSSEDIPYMESLPS